MQAVGVAELGVHRLVQVTVEVRAERIHLAVSGLALLKVETQQVLQVVGIGVAAGR